MHTRECTQQSKFNETQCYIELYLALIVHWHVKYYKVEKLLTLETVEE